MSDSCQIAYELEGDFFAKYDCRAGREVSLDFVPDLHEVIYSYTSDARRVLRWREHINSYWVMVSEVMLQQTQVPRVIEKFDEFMAAFPELEDLASASLADVLHVWQGLGYNRRGKYLWEAARMVVNDFGGEIPRDIALLETLPGVGPATARAIYVYSYNKPEVFIETNVRSVFLHFFFQGESEVPDADLLPLIEACVDQKQPREWYYALMDYGTMLKKKVGNPNRKSKHHTKQSRFEGSDRQVRARIVRELLSVRQQGKEGLTRAEIVAICDDDRADGLIDALLSEGMISQDGDVFLVG